MKARLSLRSQLAWALGGLALAMLAGVGLYLGRLAADEIVDNQQKSLHASAVAAAELLAAQLRDREREIELLSQAPHLTAGALESPLVRDSLQRRQALHDEFAWLGVTSPEGIVLQSTGGLLVGRSVAQREWFIGARERSYLGDVHEAKLLATLLPAAPNGEPTRFIDFAAPIRDGEGRLRGVVGAHAHWRWVTGIVDGTLKRQLPDAGIDALIVNREGQVLYPEAVKLAANGAALLPAGSLTSPMRWRDGRDYLMAEAPVQARTYIDLGWRIVTRQPQEVALRPVVALRNQLLLLGAAVAAGVALAAWWLARRLSQPVERLARVAQQIEADHEAAVQFPAETGSQELAQLSDAMRAMTRSLLDKEHQLRDANSTLEAQVQERTAALQAANAALEHLATHDPLTGLHNRRSLDARLAQSMALDRRYGRQNGRVHALLLIDVDHFKRINDRFGHPAGDAVLCQLALLLTQAVRSTDIAARFGGEEFAVLLPECASALEAVMAAEKIRTTVAEARFPEVEEVTVSIGVSLASPEDESVAALVARADAALYEAKRGGRNAVSLKAPSGLK